MSPENATARSLFDLLNSELRKRDVLCELCTAGGAVIPIVMAAAPHTRNVTALLGPMSALDAAERAVATDCNLSGRWIAPAVHDLLGKPADLDRSLELSNLRIYQGRPAYILAMKCLALDDDAPVEVADDVRYLLRYLNVNSVEVAFDLIGCFFAPRQLPERLEQRLHQLLSL